VLTCLRSMWPMLLRGGSGLIRTGLTIDALLLEAAFIADPLTAAVLIGVASPQSDVRPSLVHACHAEVTFGATALF